MITGRISRGFDLVRQSWSVLRKDKELMLFPVLSLIASLLVLASFAVPVLLSGDLQGLFAHKGGDGPAGAPRSPWFYAGVALYYFAAYFTVIFFNTALVSCAVFRFQGGDPTVGMGLRAAASRLPQIAGWTLVAATVGLILQMLEERVKFLGRIAIWLVGAAWTLVTFLVVPILVVEKLGPAAALRRSAELLRKAWGESLTGQATMGAAGLILSLPGMLVIAAGIAVAAAANLPAAGLTICAVGLLYFIVLAIALSTMKQIFLAGAYLYAAEGKVPSGFSEETLRAAFRKKG